MVLQVLIAYGLSQFSSKPVVAATAPNFECTDNEGESIKVWISKEGNSLQITDKGVTREIPLAAANIGRSPQNSAHLLVYNAWNMKKRSWSDRLDMSVEFVTQYLVEGGKSRVKVSLVLENRERTGLNCNSVGISVPVKAFESESTPARRYADLLNSSASLREKDGTLTPAGLFGVETSVRRMFNSADYRKKEARQEFTLNLAPGLKKIAPKSVDVIGKRLTSPVNEFWKAILEETKYSYYPETQRYITWVQEGMSAIPQHDLDSVRAGFSAFTKSLLFKEKDIRDFFTAEVNGSVKNLSEEELNSVRRGMDSRATVFLTALWTKALGKRTLLDYPQLGSILSSIDSAVNAKPEKFNALNTQTAFQTFFKSSLSQNPEARGLFLKAASVYAKKLTPRQKEDVMAWWDDSEKKNFMELLR